MQKLLTPEEVAEYLGAKVSAICQWIHQEFIQHVKSGRFVTFKHEEVGKWVECR